jgi:hypothetical protein
LRYRLDYHWLTAKLSFAVMLYFFFARSSSFLDKCGVGEVKARLPKDRHIPRQHRYSREVPTYKWLQLFVPGGMGGHWAFL